MPNRPADLQPLSIASKRPRRPEEDQAHRMALLDGTVLRWLHDAGWPQASASAHARAVEPMMSQWLGETHPEQLFNLMPSLADRLGKQLPQSRPLSASAFISAFAHCLIARAVDEVALEARRAGVTHANTETTPRRIIPAKRMAGSRVFPCAHFAMTWLSASDRTIPAAIPVPTLPNADLNTSLSKSSRRAPSAIRIPNSLVRCATV